MSRGQYQAEEAPQHLDLATPRDLSRGQPGHGLDVGGACAFWSLADWAALLLAGVWDSLWDEHLGNGVKFTAGYFKGVSGNVWDLRDIKGKDQRQEREGEVCLRRNKCGKIQRSVDKRTQLRVNRLLLSMLLWSCPMPDHHSLLVKLYF